MKLIKINPDHYIIVDDSDIEEGDYGIMDEENYEIFRCSYYMFPDGRTVPIVPRESKKITHSTKPIESINVINSIRKGYNIVIPLSLSEVKELLGETDVIKRKDEYLKKVKEEVKDYEQHDRIYILGSSDLAFTEGYNQSLEDNKDRKYTEEDMRVAIRLATTSKYDHILEFYSEADILQSLQPPTSWDVTFVDGKLKLI